MAQKTDLNINPYFDDFDSEKNFYKVLFKPGYPVQARELTTLQSILQNQVESFGSHIFKDGTVVRPGNISYDNQFYAVKLNQTNIGVDVSVYINNFIGKKITGQVSGTTAKIQYVAFPDGAEVEDLTIYVKYSNSNNNYSFNQFQDGEALVADENVTYGNTTINAGTPFATLISLNATSVGSSASIGEGTYFVRGYFANVSKQTIILDNYTNTPSYRVGLKVEETIVNAKDDSSLYDNAKGFSNYSAPGADRFKLNLVLSKKLLSDKNDTDFIELLRVENGKIKKIDNKTDFNRFQDFLAERTYEESGHYSIEDFDISVHNSLNDKLGNDGIFFNTQTTDQGNTPSDDLMCVKVSPGEAYVAGYNVEKISNTIIDVEKPRDIETITSQNIPFEMGNLLRVNNVEGAPQEKGTIALIDRPRAESGITTIGDARVYTFNLTDTVYEDDSTTWDLYLYDIQTYTSLTLNTPVGPLGFTTSTYIKGKSSGASGYAVDSGSGSIISLRQTSGTFSVGEQLIVNGIDASATVSAATVYGTKDIKSVQQLGVAAFPNFTADSLLEEFDLPNGITGGTISGGNTLVSPGKVFTGVKVGDIIRYQTTTGDETFNRVTANNTTSLTIAALTSVSGVFNGTVTNGTYSSIKLGVPVIQNQDAGYLYTELPEKNIQSVNLSNSTLEVSSQITGETTTAGGVLEFNLAATGLTDSFFKSFNNQRYSVHYTGGAIGTVTSDAFSLASNIVTINGLTASQSDIVVNTTLTKNNIQSKVKTYTRSTTLDVAFSKYQQSGVGVNTSINDGLTYNTSYGLRVQDEEISLNYPDVVKVLAVYESLGTTAPTLDTIQFADSSIVTNAVIGENITSTQNNAIARVVSKPSATTLAIVYLNQNKFTTSQSVFFEESNATTSIQTVTPGSYKNVTNSFELDKGQKEQYYDYSKLVRKLDSAIPSRRLKVIFDHYTVSSGDNGDVFTVLSYDDERFLEDIPEIGPDKVRATDTLDFRPRVSQFTDTDKSPFDFDSRTFTNDSGTLPKLILKPEEQSLLGYSYYLPRIDKILLDNFGNFIVKKGVSSKNPKAPVNSNPNKLMDLGTITLPAYLYSPNDATISLVDNRRYTMRDIGDLEDRIENLEKVTSLSLLELTTQTTQIQDADGNLKYKTGFFVDDFKNDSLINLNVSSIQVDAEQQELIPIISRNTLKSQIAPQTNTSSETLDFSNNFNLLDSNVQKTGNAITLAYDSSDWIEQPLATGFENVNPFNIVSYKGFVKLSPSNDSWIKTIKLPKGVFTFSGNDQYMRSRNTHFSATNLLQSTQFYQFFDGNSGVDFIPKLLEIATDDTLSTYGSDGTFQVGETVIGYDDNESIIKFRVANSNHKTGTYNSPTTTFGTNPYATTETLSNAYSQSSKVLNVDTLALSEEAQGRYFGYLTQGAKLVGQTSGAVAYVKDLRLISDEYGDLIGSFFLRDPNTTPPPTVRIGTGTKTYKLTSSSANEIPQDGSNSISTAEVQYTSKLRTTLNQQNKLVKTVTNYYNPLAQTFSVGGNIESPDAIGQNDDANGAFLTKLDLFFKSKPTDNHPIRVEIRPVNLGSPVQKIIGNPVTLKPSQVNTSTTGATATTVTFDYPIYLSPGKEYAIVLISETTDEYEVWTATMGETTINTQNLPDSEAVIYSQQFALGSLFKSQNGSIWTPNQNQDLKFKLYKANFTSTTGTAFFYNPPLDESNGYVEKLNDNPITILPKTLTLGITTIADGDGNIGILTVGRKISGSNDFGYGYVVGQGSSVGQVSITDGGSNYPTGTIVNLPTTNIVGSGSGLRLSVTANATGSITAIAATTATGNGYKVGDVVGITTNLGTGARFTIADITGLDTLYLSNVQGELGAGNAFQVGAAVSYYNDSGTVISLASTTITNRTTEGSNLNSGNYMTVKHFDHGMYSNTNTVVLTDIEPDTSPTTLSADLDLDETGTVSVASTSGFATFEGQTVSAAYTGYALIGDEIIAYTSVGSGTLTIAGSGRGKDNTITQPHASGSSIYKYELGGVSLRRINGVEHTVSNLENKIDSYNIQINMSTNGSDRSNDDDPTDAAQLSFASEASVGGSKCKATENLQFNEIVPSYDILTPGSSTSVSASVRTITGRSVDGTETPFVDNGFETVELNEVNKLTSVRMVASEVNEDDKLTTLPNNKSFTTAIVLNTTDTNLSPIIYTDNSITEFRLSRLNSPISDYTASNSVNSLLFDPHAAIYVSNTVNLTQASTSLKVIFDAYRHESADFRVLYSLIKADSSEVTQEFELFPGYDNLTLTSTGLDIINAANNSGRSDVFVPASLEDEYLEYEYTANNLDLFTGYTIKIVMSGTNQAYAPRIKNLRTIAVI